MNTHNEFDFHEDTSAGTLVRGWQLPGERLFSEKKTRTDKKLQTVTFDPRKLSTSEATLLVEDGPRTTSGGRRKLCNLKSKKVFNKVRLNLRPQANGRNQKWTQIYEKESIFCCQLKRFSMEFWCRSDRKGGSESGTASDAVRWGE